MLTCNIDHQKVKILKFCRLCRVRLESNLKESCKLRQVRHYETINIDDLGILFLIACIHRGFCNHIEEWIECKINRVLLVISCQPCGIFKFYLNSFQGLLPVHKDTVRMHRRVHFAFRLEHIIFKFLQSRQQKFLQSRESFYICVVSDVPLRLRWM